MVSETRAAVFVRLWTEPRYLRIHATKDRANRGITVALSSRDTAGATRAMRRLKRACLVLQRYEDAALVAAGVRP